MMDLELIAVVGATIQTMGVWALAGLLLLVSKALRVPYIRTWAWGWVWLAGALTMLQIGFRIPSAALVLRTFYLFGEWAFVWQMYRGGRSFASEEVTPWPHPILLGLAVIYSLALPFWLRDFTSCFVMQAILLSLALFWVSYRHHILMRRWGGGLGAWVTLTGLLLLAANFAFHAVALGLFTTVHLRLPDGYAHFTSLYDFLFEMILAFGLVVLAMQDASRRIHALTRLLPMCAWCRKIRGDEGYWTEFEGWVKSQGHMDVTHGICPECQAKMMDESA